ncbi:MAG: LapA family protein [Planctomycetes bacterium]|nr:LapA family protein [Planctomycetota bacterium]
MSLRHIVAALVAVLLALFVISNFEQAQVSFLGMRLEMPLAFVILGSALLGAVIALGWTILRGRRGSKSP